MSDDRDDFPRYDPFDDTSGWPYRDAPTPPRRDERESEAPSTRLAPAEAEPPRRLERPGAEPGSNETRAPAADEPAWGDGPPDADAGHEGEPRLVGESPGDEDVAEEASENALPAAPELAAVRATEPTPAGEEAAPAHEAAAEAVAPPEAQHAAGELEIPDGHTVVEGAPNGFRRTVAVVVGRFNGDISNRLLASALAALEDAHVAKESITIVPVPGAFELPLAAMALAKTRRYSCVVALGCVIRGETPHFDFVAGEAASGLQLAAIETGIPVSFGVLTCESREQAEARVDKGAEAARAGLEMAELFAQLRTHVAAAAR